MLRSRARGKEIQRMVLAPSRSEWSWEDERERQTKERHPKAREDPLAANRGCRRISQN